MYVHSYTRLVKIFEKIDYIFFMCVDVSICDDGHSCICMCICRYSYMFVRVCTVRLYIPANHDVQSIVCWSNRIQVPVSCIHMNEAHIRSWRHQMETFSALLAICAGNWPVPGEFPAQRPVTRNFDVFFDLRPDKRLSKQWWGRWFETPSSPLWRHCYNHWKIRTTKINMLGRKMGMIGIPNIVVIQLYLYIGEAAQRCPIKLLSLPLRLWHN